MLKHAGVASRAISLGIVVPTSLPPSPKRCGCGKRVPCESQLTHAHQGPHRVKVSREDSRKVWHLPSGIREARGVVSSPSDIVVPTSTASPWLFYPPPALLPSVLDLTLRPVRLPAVVPAPLPPSPLQPRDLGRRGIRHVVVGEFAWRGCQRWQGKIWCWRCAFRWRGRRSRKVRFVGNRLEEVVHERDSICSTHRP